MITSETRNISVTVQAPLDFSYDFLHRPENFPLWASGLCKSIKKQDGEWIAETPNGAMKVAFTEWNKFGILDHLVFGPKGTFYVSMRIIPNGQGSELVFTLFRAPEMTDEDLNRDVEWVKKDLNEVRNLLGRLYALEKEKNDKEKSYA